VDRLANQTGESNGMSAARRAKRGKQPMIIYGSTMSPFVRKVVACAVEKGVEFELEPVIFRSPRPEFLEASPFRRMPALRDGSFTLPDSSAIIHYLEAKHPEPAMIPADPELRGKTIWYEEFADTILVSCGAKIFFNLIVAPRFLGRPGDEWRNRQNSTTYRRSWNISKK
jgi:glutathione S-transferase